MKHKKLIWVACGSGVASSTMATQALKGLCAQRGLDVDIEIVAFRDMRGKAHKPDLLVSIAPGIEQGKFAGLEGVPVIQGVSLLTGIGKEKTMDEIVAALNT